MMTNPIPEDFSPESINMLYTLKHTPNDELLMTAPIRLQLQRKWDKYAYSFYLIQFLMFVGQLITLIIYNQMDDGPTAKTVSIVALCFNGYFIFFELL